MARDLYMNTIVAAQADGTLKALAGVQTYVYSPGTTTVVAIYQGRTGAAQQANPMLTDTTGSVSFYADVGEYDVRIVDTNVPPRIADQTFQWNAFNGSAQGIPSSLLKRDAGLDLSMFAADLLRQLIPIGQVIEWWRPAATVPIPSGFEIADGRTIAANAHDFGTGSPIALPDLRNMFIIGADSLKSDGAPSSNGDGTAASGVASPNAPGIGGAGGSNTSKNLSHQHTAPGHRHGITDPGHVHSISDPTHAHSIYDPAHAHNIGVGGRSAGASNTVAVGDSAGRTGAVTPGGGIDASGTGIGIYAAATGVSVVSKVTGITVGPAGATLGDSDYSTIGTNLSTASDMRPAHIGLLRLMKVRRS